VGRRRGRAVNKYHIKLSFQREELHFIIQLAAFWVMTPRSIVGGYQKITA
jgi:hypothetical protein